MADNSAPNTPLYGGYAVSPESLKFRRQQLAELLKQGMSTEPIRSPWQGAARLAETLVGAMYGNKLDKEEREARTEQIKTAVEAISGSDRAKMLAAALNPYTPDTLQHIVGERAFPQQLNNGAYNYPANQISGQPMPGAVPRVPEGTFQAGPAAMPGFGEPAGTPPPGGGPTPIPAPRPAGAPAPQVQPQQPQAGGLSRLDTLGAKGAELTSKLDEAKAKMGTLMGLQNRGLESKQKLDEFGQFTNLAEKSGYGLTSELKTWAANHGFQTQGVPVEQLYTDMIKFYGPQLRPEGSGGFRGPELGGFYNSLGGLMRTPEGRRAGMSFVSRAHQWNATAGAIAGDARLSADERFNKINEMKLPDIDLSKLSKPQPTKEEAIQELRRRGVSGF